MVLNIWFSVCAMAGAVTGIGKRPAELARSAEIEAPLLAAYVWVATIARISIALTTLRITSRRRDSAVMYTVITLAGLIGAAFWLVLTLQCQPIRKFWHPSEPGGCLQIRTFTCIEGRNWQQWPFLAWDACAAVIARIPYIHEMPGTKGAGFLYATSSIALTSILEVGLGITAGSLITLRPLLRWFRNRIHGVFQRRSPGLESGLNEFQSNDQATVATVCTV
ncbi:hypothetical protein PMG11_05727 [Penicillium brasilianum]|uniref:Rhodopsin domain-containing protein n=1 Tax=Penicillium brasilianum TaxID=104259 RepID=A0A0F7TKC3_PENBI|nr:hypothetical protein PMG11_05727 [Penicillium brasilianum]